MLNLLMMVAIVSLLAFCFGVALGVSMERGEAAARRPWEFGSDVRHVRGGAIITPFAKSGRN